MSNANDYMRFNNNLSIETSQVPNPFQQPGILSPTFTYEQQSPGIFEIGDEFYMGLTTNSNECLKNSQGIDAHAFYTSTDNNNNNNDLMLVNERVQFESGDNNQQQHLGETRLVKERSQRVSKGDTAEFPKEDEQLHYNQYLHRGSILNDNDLRMSQIELDVQRIREETLRRQKVQLDSQMLELAMQQQQVKKELTQIYKHEGAKGEQVIIKRLNGLMQQPMGGEDTLYSTIGQPRINSPANVSSTFNISSSRRTTSHNNYPGESNQYQESNQVIYDTRIQRMKNMLYDAKLKIEGGAGNTYPQAQIPTEKIVEEKVQHARKPSEFDASLLTQWRDDIDRVRDSLRRMQETTIKTTTHQHQKNKSVTKSKSPNHKQLRFDSDDMYVSYLKQNQREQQHQQVVNRRQSSPTQAANHLEDRIKQAKVNLEHKIAMRVKLKQERDSVYREKTPQKAYAPISTRISPYRKDIGKSNEKNTWPSKSPPRIVEHRSTSRLSSRPKPEWNYSTKTLESPDAKRAPGDKRKPPTTINNSPEVSQHQFTTISSHRQTDSQQTTSRNVSNLPQKISMPTKKSEFLSLQLSPPNEIKNQAVKVIQRLRQYSQQRKNNVDNNSSTQDTLSHENLATASVQTNQTQPKKLNVVRLINKPPPLPKTNMSKIEVLVTSPTQIKSPGYKSRERSKSTITSRERPQTKVTAPVLLKKELKFPSNSRNPSMTNRPKTSSQVSYSKPIDRQGQQQKAALVIVQNPLRSSRAASTSQAPPSKQASQIPAKETKTPAKVKDLQYMKKCDDKLMRLIATSPSRTLKSKFMIPSSKEEGEDGCKKTTKGVVFATQQTDINSNKNNAN